MTYGDFSAHILGSQTTQELYLRSTMKQDRRNNCLFDLLSQKSIADTLDIVKIAKRFPCAKELHKGHFVKFEQGCAHGWEKDDPPPRFKTLCRWAGHLNSNKYLTEQLAVICHRSLKHCQIIFVNNLSYVSAQSISWPWPILLRGPLTVCCFLLWFLSYHTGFRLALLSYSLIFFCGGKERDVGNEGTLAGWYEKRRLDKKGFRKFLMRYTSKTQSYLGDNKRKDRLKLFVCWVELPKTLSIYPQFIYIQHVVMRHKNCTYITIIMVLKGEWI